MSKNSEKVTNNLSVTDHSYSDPSQFGRPEGVKLRVQTQMVVIGLHSIRGERAIIHDEQDKPLSKRQQEEQRQDEIRTCLRVVINDLAGSWTTARGLAELSRTKYPYLAQYIESKSVSEYLKTMHLRTKKVMTTLYFCERQYEELSP